MKKTLNLKIGIFAPSVVLLAGCATMEQSAGLAALGCGAVGALTGVLTNNAGAGAGAGAGCMALAGLALYNYHSSQTRTVEQDQRLYGYTAPVNSTEVKIRTATAYPETVHVGDTVKIGMDYSVMAPQGTPSVNVTESMVLKHDGKTLKTLSERPVSRPLGGGSSEVDFKIPAKMPSGTYVVEQKVQAGTSYDIRPTVFVVGS
ncbi:MULTISPECIES: hypothetical protein [Methylomicrobium]|uniref:Glycine zipper domain-containing protein n=1 Tax=Methylomicrobium album BG8 TaxID=686340 RepID=H8GPI8_METAL|nr:MULTISPECIES: hypothetical protein [Methylomicrobium]EIC30934.1 hypothetical protein Metal_3264 [Methylomicrobium album BG8]